MIFLEEGAWVWLHLNHFFADHDLRKVSLPWFGSNPETPQETLESSNRRNWKLRFTRSLKEDRWLWWIYRGFEKCWCYIWHGNLPLTNLTHEKNELEGHWLRGCSDLLESFCAKPTLEFAAWARAQDPSWFNDRPIWPTFFDSETTEMNGIIINMTLRTQLSKFFCDCWLDPIRLICWMTSIEDLLATTPEEWDLEQIFFWLSFLMVCVDLILQLLLIPWAMTSLWFFFWSDLVADLIVAAKAELALAVEHDETAVDEVQEA